MSDALHSLSLWLIPGCPLAATVLVGLFGKAVFGRASHRPVIAALVVSCLLSLWQLGAVATRARVKPAAEASPGAGKPPRDRHKTFRWRMASTGSAWEISPSGPTCKSTR